MSDTQQPVIQSSNDDLGGAKLVYILYFVSLLVGITGLIGVIIAYIKRGDAGSVAASHYTYLIRTFWIGLLFAIISIITMIILVGYLIALATLVWFLVRCIKGFLLSLDGKPVADPGTWLW